MIASTDDQLNDAREAMMTSIRAHLAESARLHPTDAPAIVAETPRVTRSTDSDNARVAIFCERLESVGGRSVVARSEDEARLALGEIVNELRAHTGLRVALSNAPLVGELARQLDVQQVTVDPRVADLFDYDVGITTAQAAIAETGTLVLEAEKERHRFVSLLPPIHIAVVRSSDLCWTIGDALERLRQRDQLSRAITFITGPSRTADIELTLTVGVHGPRELFVIVIDYV
ncbi:MAG TPA: lactate utilization protein [Pyrinomonadaceae bacterium]|nr:lactate utilization protein [Pyrinomonadaceae bacterium]